ncbi:MAG TPA: glutaredoxin domain-containing protein [Bacteroidales bacterium]|nr:glutaredoxin domain-containing protein [Bacteroidales bacterium]
MITHVKSLAELQEKLEGQDKTYLLIYKKGSEQSDCAYGHLQDASDGINDIQLLAVDVSEVRDIHPNYHVSSAPTLLEFEKQSQKNMIKGCHESAYFKAMLEDAVYHSEMKKQGKPQKRVTVYSTPTCTWCNTLKSYLKQNRIRFSDIDVSRDQNAATEMVNRSGQQGVPQTDINGTMIVGFDKKRINELLEIQG